MRIYRAGALLLVCVAVTFAAAIAQMTPATPVIINVKDYGAIGDGIGDDTAAINRAITAIPPTGGTLYFPCGTYLVTSSPLPIRISHVTITGPSTSCATLKASGAANITMLELGGGSPGLSQPEFLASDTTANTFTVGGGGLAKLGIRVGSYVLVSDAGTPSHGPGSPLISDQQTVKVTSVSGDTATIENAFSTPFTVLGGSYVQKIMKPVVGSLISYLAFDATSNVGTGTFGISLPLAVSSVIEHVSVTGPQGGGIVVDWGYKNHVHDVVCIKCGNGTVGAQSVMIRRQTFTVAKNLTVTNSSSQSVFGFALHQVHFSTVQNVAVDAGGANGRPFKLLRSSNNTLSYVTANNGGGGHNGISITDKSTYNTFNNCVALNNTGNGIITFGDHNTNNTFNNCIAKYNTQSQIGQMAAWDGTYTDFYNTVNGGTFCCVRAVHRAVVAIYSDYTTLTGAVITDDQQLARNGLLVSAFGVTVQNNQFSGLPKLHDIYVLSGMSSSTYSGNVTPDGTTPAGVP